MLIKNKLYVILGLCLILLCTCYSMYFVYGSNSVEYSLNEVEVEYLFALEQDILVKNSISMDAESYEKVDDLSKLDCLEETANKTEESVLNGVNNIKIKEVEEEYYTSNKLSSRKIGNGEVGSALETDDEKYYRIFGSDYKSKMGRCCFYYSDSAARQDMVGFYTDVWDIDNSGNWYKKNVYIECHKNIEETMKCIMNDLLEVPEYKRTPIKDIGMYNYRDGYSNHTCGVAVDINWNENAEMTNSGRITCGSYWKPGVDIYSIPADSEMVRIFKEYGFGWGGEWTSKKDYMHFSYFDR